MVTAFFIRRNVNLKKPRLIPTFRAAFFSCRVARGRVPGGDTIRHPIPESYPFLARGGGRGRGAIGWDGCFLSSAQAPLDRRHRSARILFFSLCTVPTVAVGYYENGTCGVLKTSLTWSTANPPVVTWLRSHNGNLSRSFCINRQG